MTFRQISVFAVTGLLISGAAHAQNAATQAAPPRHHWGEPLVITQQGAKMISRLVAFLS